MKQNKFIKQLIACERAWTDYKQKNAVVESPDNNDDIVRQGVVIGYDGIHYTVLKGRWPYDVFMAGFDAALAMRKKENEKCKYHT